MIIKLLVEGGEMKPNPGIAQKLGPLGINIGKVIQEVNKATANFKGMKVPAELDINSKTKEFSVSVSSPPVSELLKRELGIDKASGEAKKIKAGNLSIEQVIKIAKTKYPNMLANNLKSAVKSVVGSCVSLGILIESKEPKEIEKEIFAGKFEKEISEEKETATSEKLQKLKQDFEQIRKKQEEVKKQEEEKKLEEEKKAEEEKAKTAEKKPEETAKPEAAEAKKEEPAKKQEAKKK